MATTKKNMTILVGIRVQRSHILSALSSGLLGSQWAEHVSDERHLNWKALMLGIEIKDIERKKPRTFTLDIVSLYDGLPAMAADSPSQFAALLKGDIDDIVGDTLIQCCLFGKTIYG